MNYLSILKAAIILSQIPLHCLEEAIANQAERHFKKWFDSGNEFLIDFQNVFTRNSWNKAVFELHEATGRYFMTTLLVFTGYKPKLHDLEKLNRQVIPQHRSFITIFPSLQNKKNKILFS